MKYQKYQKSIVIIVWLKIVLLLQLKKWKQLNGWDVLCATFNFVIKTEILPIIIGFYRKPAKREQWSNI